MSKRKGGRENSGGFRRVAALAFAVLAAIVGLTVFQRKTPPIPDPDTSAMEPQVAARIKEAREAAKNDPGSGERWGRLGMVFQAHELYREAQETYAVARTLDEHNFRWPYLQSQSLKEIQEIDTALDAARTAISIESGYAPLLVLEGELHEQAGRTEDAMSSYRKALAIDSGCAVAEFGLGRLELERGNLSESLSHLERAASIEPDAGAIQATLARAQSRAGHKEEALAVSKLARALTPEVTLDDPVMARVLEEAVSLVGYQRRAAEAEARGEPARAEALLRRMIELRPEEADLHYNLANNLSRQNRSQEAEESYRKALSLDPEHVTTLINLGILLSQRGDLVAAKRFFEKALALEPEHPGALASRPAS